MLKVAIVGYGVVGKKRHACLIDNRHAEVVAVCDQRAEMMDDLDPEIRSYTTFQGILDAQDRIDAVFVCLSNDMLATVTKSFLRYGAHVFCEKPPARSTNELKLVSEVYPEHSSQKLMYGFNHRYHQSVQDALCLIQSGKLGQVINARGIYGKSKLITYDQTTWRTQRAIAGGGVLLDQGIHMVDLLRQFCGEFDEVKSYVSNDHWSHDVECNAYALMKTGRGVVAMLHSSATQWRHRFELEISLTKGALKLAGFLTGSKSYGDETLRITWCDSRGRGVLQEEVRHYLHDSSWQLEVDYFIDCILHDRTVKNGHLNDAYQTLRLVESIYLADPVWQAKIQSFEGVM